MKEHVAVIGLGYVGLPLFLAFAREFPDAVGFDVNNDRIEALCRGEDHTKEVPVDVLKGASYHFTSDLSDLEGSTFFIVTVPTPIDRNRRPDLGFLRSASEMIGSVLQRGAVVVYESTVYPGLTEEFCGPILARTSGLRQGDDFKLAYSPERINPGDKEHRLETIVKVVAAEDEATLERVAELYEAVVPAGIHRAPSIKVAEAAKVIENTQRDLNIALMNELALIFDRLGIRTHDVLEAAGTKWNFLPFRPGLVGGHCISVDPYYLTTKAEELGYQPQVILAGRRINDGTGVYIAQRLIKLLVNSGHPVKGARVGMLGLTFKENVPDLRNSRVPDIVAELQQFGIEPLVHDPLADHAEAAHEYGIRLVSPEELSQLDALVLAVPHHAYTESLTDTLAYLKPRGVLVDIKSVFDPSKLPSGIHYWSL